MPSLGLYRVFDENVLLMSEIHSLEVHLSTYLKGLSHLDDAFEKATLRLAVFKAPHSKALICCPEVGFANLVAIDTKCYIMFRQFLRIVLFSGKYPYYPLHACCVADERGRASLIAGLPRSGKTSLTAALLQRGFRFAGDDQAYLTEDGHVLAFPVGSSVAPRTFQFIPELLPLQIDECRFRGHEGWEWTVYYGDVFPSVSAYESLPVSHIFFVQPNFGGESSVRECDSDVAQWHFLNMRHVARGMIVPLQLADPATYMRSLSLTRILHQQARFFEVLNGDLHATADRIVQEIRG